VSFQITILKVLAGHPEGRACVSDLTRCVSVLISSGSDWANRMKRLADRAPELDIFKSAFVLRDDNGWQITAIGRQFLASLETPIPAAADQPCDADIGMNPTALTPVQPVLRLAVDNTRKSKSNLGPDQARQSA
jgi:hypothetical protein